MNARGPLLVMAAPRWVALAAVASFTWMAATALLLGWGLRHFRTNHAASSPREATTDAARSQVTSASPNASASAAPPTGEHERALPRATRASTLGAIELVELGVASGDLSASLREEMKVARGSNRTMLVLVTEELDCATCRGIDEALADSRLQEALATVRLVRVARSAFKEEMAALRIQTDLYPMFLLFRDDLSLLDAIHGGEWDADIAINIAPVLAAFVRGQYRDRRHPAWTPALRGLRL